MLESVHNTNNCKEIVDLGEFITITQNQLADFELWYKKKNKENPIRYPIELKEERKEYWFDVFYQYKISLQEPNDV